MKCRAAPPCPTGSTGVLARDLPLFNEGYLASSGDTLTRHDLSGSHRLGRLLVEFAAGAGSRGPPRAHAAAGIGRAARTSPKGSSSARRPGPFRSGTRADRGRQALVEVASHRGVSPYTLQAAIARCTRKRRRPSDRLGADLSGLRLLLRVEPSPVIGADRAWRSRCATVPRGLGPHRRDPRARRPGRLLLAHSPGRPLPPLVNRRRRVLPTNGPSTSPAGLRGRFLEQRLRSSKNNSGGMSNSPPRVRLKVTTKEKCHEGSREHALRHETHGLGRFKRSSRHGRAMKYLLPHLPGRERAGRDARGRAECPQRGALDYNDGLARAAISSKGSLEPWPPPPASASATASRRSPTVPLPDEGTAGGFYFVEARDLNEAIQIAASFPPLPLEESR